MENVKQKFEEASCLAGDVKSSEKVVPLSSAVFLCNLAIAEKEKEIVRMIKLKEPEIEERLYGFDYYPRSDKQASEIVSMIINLINSKK